MLWIIFLSYSVFVFLINMFKHFRNKDIKFLTTKSNFQMNMLQFYKWNCCKGIILWSEPCQVWLYPYSKLVLPGPGIEPESWNFPWIHPLVHNHIWFIFHLLWPWLMHHRLFVWLKTWENDAVTCSSITFIIGSASFTMMEGLIQRTVTLLSKTPQSNSSRPMLESGRITLKPLNFKTIKVRQNLWVRMGCILFLLLLKP